MEESYNISVIKNAIREIIESEKDSSQVFPRLNTGILFEDAKKPFIDILLPLGYALSPYGVFSFSLSHNQDNDISLVYLTKTPFFIASRNSVDGKVLLLRYINNEWLREWTKPSKLTPNSLMDLLILPEAGVNVKELSEYAITSASVSPLVHAGDDFKTVAQEIIDKLLNEDKPFPQYVSISSVRDMCQGYETSYEDLRKWLVQRGITEEESVVKRDNTIGGVTRRMLIFTKGDLS